MEKRLERLPGVFDGSQKKANLRGPGCAPEEALLAPPQDPCPQGNHGLAPADGEPASLPGPQAIQKPSSGPSQRMPTG